MTVNQRAVENVMGLSRVQWTLYWFNYQKVYFPICIHAIPLAQAKNYLFNEPAD